MSGTAREPKPPVLVTGATGNVGAPLVALVRHAGVHVRAAARDGRHVVDRFGQGTRPGAAADVTPVSLDFTEPTTWPDAFRGVDRMFLVRPPHLGAPKRQMLPAMAAAKAAGVQHVVLLSLQGAGHNRLVPHATLEAWLRESGLDWTFVRPSFFMQNLSGTHAVDIRDNDRIVVPAGDGATAFVDARDVAAVAAAALLDPDRHRNTTWTPTGDRALTYDEVARTLTDALGRPIYYTRPGTLGWIRHARKELRLPWGMVAVTTAIYTTARLGRADGITDDVHTVTGQAPTTFRDFAIREVAAWER